MKFVRVVISFSIAAILLSSCGQNNTLTGISEVSANLPQLYSPQLTKQLLDEAKKCEDKELANTKYLEALNSLASYANIKRAEEVKKQIKIANLTTEQMQILKLIESKFLMLKGKNNNAITNLNNISSANDSITNIRDILLVKAHSKAREIVKAINLINNLTDEDLKNQLFAETLRQQEKYTLTAALNENCPDFAKAWIEFEIINRDSSSNQVAEKIKIWQQKYPRHPANKLINGIPETTQKKVAILLPLQGDLADTSKKIIQGFLAAYYDNKLGNESNLSVVVKDTSDDGAYQKIKELKEEKIDTIITGIGKDKLDDFSEVPKTTRLIYLDNPVENKAEKNIYYYSLSPSNETKALSRAIFKNGYGKILVITTTENIHQKIAKTFQESWESLGGTYAKTVLVDRSNFSQSLKESFSIDESENRATELEKLINQKFKFVPTRRNDIDAIFLATNPTDARQIKPLLKYYFAGDIPVFSTSSIYNTGSNSYTDKDLNGIIFRDSAWLVNFNQDRNIKSKLQQIWGQDFESRKRLYALGVDLYRITMNINNLESLPLFQISAASGNLELNTGSVIERSLDWLRFSRGTPKILETFNKTY